MLSLLNFKRKSYMIDMDNKLTIVSLPLSIPEFKTLYFKYDKPEDGLKALSLVANVGHYGSPGNITGLTQKEIISDAKQNLGITTKIEQTNEFKRALIVFEKHYSKGIFGMFKEINKTFELTRRSVKVINLSLEAMTKDLENQQKLKTDSPAEIIIKIKEVISAVTNVRELTSELSKDVESLKQIEKILLSEDETSVELYGGGTIPDSAKVDM